jgi:F-type H+-transporting ATPase subunit a
MLVLVIGSWIAARQLNLQPGALQVALEGIMGAIDDAIRSVLPGHSERILPFIATLWIFIVLANLIGLIPGIHAPTSDLSVTAALAVLVFLSVHWFGIRIEGVKQYLRHYLAPSPLLLPFHIISEITRTLTLAVRLFGNMMSLEMAALLVLLVAGFLAPIPLLMLHIVEALIQAYIFGMLALIYLAGAIQTRALHSPSEKG